MMKKTPAPAPFTIPDAPATTAARTALCAAQTRVLEIIERRGTKQTHIDRLVAQGSVVRAALAALADFDSQHTQRIEEWTTNRCEGPKPEADRKQRDRLVKAVEDVEADQRCFDEVRARLSSEMVPLGEEIAMANAAVRAAQVAVVSATGEAVMAMLRERAEESKQLALLVTAWRNFAQFGFTEKDLTQAASLAYGNATGMRPENAAARVLMAHIQSQSLGGDEYRAFIELRDAWESFFVTLSANPAAKIFDERREQEAAKAA